MAEFGGSGTEKKTAATTTDDSENDDGVVAITFRESGRIVVGKKGGKAGTGDWLRKQCRV